MLTLGRLRSLFSVASAHSVLNQTRHSGRIILLRMTAHASLLLSYVGCKLSASDAMFEASSQC